MSVRTISIHSVREIDLEVFFAHVEQFQIEKSAAMGASGSFFLPPSLMQTLNHDPPPPHPNVKREIVVGPVGSMAQPSVLCVLISPLTDGCEKKETQLLNKKGGADFSPPSHSRLQTTRAKHETRNCVQTRSGMRTAARVRRVCSR